MKNKGVKYVNYPRTEDERLYKNARSRLCRWKGKLHEIIHQVNIYNRVIASINIHYDIFVQMQPIEQLQLVTKLHTDVSLEIYLEESAKINLPKGSYSLDQLYQKRIEKVAKRNNISFENLAKMEPRELETYVNEEMKNIARIESEERAQKKLEKVIKSQVQQKAQAYQNYKASIIARPVPLDNEERTVLEWWNYTFENNYKELAIGYLGCRKEYNFHIGYHTVDYLLPQEYIKNNKITTYKKWKENLPIMDQLARKLTIEERLTKPTETPETLETLELPVYNKEHIIAYDDIMFMVKSIINVLSLNASSFIVHTSLAA